MSGYALALVVLVLALAAQSLATGVALEVTLREPYRRPWMTLALGSGLLALHHGYDLELALRSGLYDLRQATLAALVAVLLAVAVFGLRRQIRQES